jgi:hypothetical protein
MREPVDRLISHYYYLKRFYNSGNAPNLHRKVVEEDWSLEQFCFSTELRNLYSQFLWGFPLEYFDFIGITEFYDDDLSYFSRHYLNADLEPYKENVGTNESGKYQIDTGFRTMIEQFHSLDVKLYDDALVMRQKRVTSMT